MSFSDYDYPSDVDFEEPKKIEKPKKPRNKNECVECGDITDLITCEFNKPPTLCEGCLEHNEYYNCRICQICDRKYIPCDYHCECYSVCPICDPNCLCPLCNDNPGDLSDLHMYLAYKRMAMFGDGDPEEVKKFKSIKMDFVSFFLPPDIADIVGQYV